MQALILILCGVVAFVIASPFIALWRRWQDVSNRPVDMRRLRAAARERDMARKVRAARRQRLAS